VDWEEVGVDWEEVGVACQSSPRETPSAAQTA